MRRRVRQASVVPRLAKPARQNVSGFVSWSQWHIRLPVPRPAISGPAHVCRAGFAGRGTALA